jgi:ribonuclease HII
MPFVIGTDEAGLGPNLGPLVITATLWETADDRESIDEFARILQTHHRQELDRPLIGDSKLVYQSGSSLGGLEQVVLAALKCCVNPVWADVSQGSISDFIHRLTNQTFSPIDKNLFLKGNTKLPIAADSMVVKSIVDAWQKAQVETNCKLICIRCVVVFPAMFNESVALWKNKATMLTSTTLELVKHVLHECCDATTITCDRHGGRKFYHSAIQQFLTDQWIDIDLETPDQSAYRWKHQDHDMSILFATQGEKFTEVGLASMVSKYLRELAMFNWNRYWQTIMPGIKPTAGYHVDARRFHDEIQHRLDDCNLSTTQVWRAC